MKPSQIAELLVVDDDDDHRAVLMGCLRGQGYSVVGAENGKVALEALGASSQLPRAIVLDVDMPVMDGWDLIEVLRSHPRLAALPVVVVSGHPRDERFSSIPLIRFVSKPCDPKELLATIDELMRRSRDVTAPASRDYRS